MAEWILASSAQIIFIIFIRELFKETVAPRFLRFLWLLAMFRLVLPFGFFSCRLSVLNLLEGEVDMGYFTVVWACGAVCLTAALILSRLIVCAKLRTESCKFDYAYKLPVYLNDEIQGPLMTGIIKPAVYINREISENDRFLPLVLAHEFVHSKHMDGLWTFGRCICLALHWYNPLVWLAAGLSALDCELSCDEECLTLLGKAKRAEYGRAVVFVSRSRFALNEIAGCLLFISENRGFLRTRTEFIAVRHKDSWVYTALFFASMVICFLFTFTGSVA